MLLNDYLNNILQGSKLFLRNNLQYLAIFQVCNYKIPEKSSVFISGHLSADCCLDFTKRNNKKKPKVGRAVAVWQKDFGIMPCSCLTRHPSGLIPIPFGLSAPRPVKLLSFSFFRFSVFFGKISFFLVSTQLQLYLQDLAGIYLQKSKIL